MTKRNDHTFAICAYKESPYLEECILSLKNQTVKSNIIMATSTPNEWIQGLAEKYEIQVKVGLPKTGILHTDRQKQTMSRSPIRMISMNRII